MRQFEIHNDKILDKGEVSYLGIHVNNLKNNIISLEDKEWLPFLRFCYSLGDLGVLSGIFEAIKQKYPNIKIAIPSNEYLLNVFGENYLSQWNYKNTTGAFNNIVDIYKNNPYIDGLFDVGNFPQIYTDHDRCYTSLDTVDGKICSTPEPLAKQILRRFGFTEEELYNIDIKPKLYFDKEETQNFKQKLHNIIGDKEYGCLLFASRFNKDTRWEHDNLLFEAAEKFKNKPVFYYSSFDLTNTPWDSYFPERYNFLELNIPIREQLYIKSEALFNISYQAGITDASNIGKSENHILVPNNTIRENCIQDTYYYYPNGEIKKY